MVAVLYMCTVLNCMCVLYPVGYHVLPEELPAAGAPADAAQGLPAGGGQHIKPNQTMLHQPCSIVTLPLSTGYQGASL